VQIATLWILDSEDGRSGNIPLWSNIAQWTAMNRRRDRDDGSCVQTRKKSHMDLCAWWGHDAGVQVGTSRGWSTQMWLCSWNLEHVQTAVVPTDIASGCIWDPWPKGNQRQPFFFPGSNIIIWVLWVLSSISLYVQYCSILQTALGFRVSPADVLDWEKERVYRIYLKWLTSMKPLTPTKSIPKKIFSHRAAV
jgi:hypothetical protein